MADPGPLIVSGGGIVGVETDAMAAAAVQLALVESSLEELRRRSEHAPSIAAASARSAPDGVAALLADTARAADTAAERLHDALSAALSRAREVSDALRTAATGYADAEASAAEWIAKVSAAAAWTMGAAGSIAPAAPLVAVVAAWLAWRLGPGTAAERTAALGSWMTRHPELITNPAFVAAVRAIAGSTDDFLFGGARLPTPGWKRGGSGVEFGGDAVLATGAMIGMFRESSVRVSLVRSGGTSPPAGLAERFGRIPGAETGGEKRGPGGAQVRIERYAAPGERPHWIVYVDPTETFTPRSTEEPWDLTSNIDGVAGHTAGSFVATETAMREAGIDSDDPVALVGFSQGGLVAGMLAGSGEWNARSLESFGGPIGNLPLPDGLGGMTVRHSDDFVPALAGPDLPSDRLLVEQRAYPDGGPTDLPAPAHQARSYLATAEELDRAASPAVRTQLDAVQRFASEPMTRPGATATFYEFRADRAGDRGPAFATPRAPRVF